MRRATVLLVLLTAPAGPAFLAPAAAIAESADEAERVFQALCGPEYKRVMAARDPSGAVALAATLLAASRATDVQPALFALLCERTYELGARHASGYATAVDAMELLAAKAPDRKADCLEKIIVIRQRQFDAARKDARTGEADILAETILAAADAKTPTGSEAEGILLRRALAVASAAGLEARTEIQTRINRNAMRQRGRKQAADLKARLAAGSLDAAARKEAVRLCLVDLDDPAEAATFIDESVDESLRKRVPAAAKGVGAAPELACTELGQWYHGLAADAAPVAKAPMLARSRQYLERFLELHAAQDATRMLVEQVLAGVQDEIAKLTPVAIGPMDRNLVLGVWLFRQQAAPLRDSRKRPVTIQGDWGWMADDGFEKPTEVAEFRKAGVIWPNEPAFMLRAGGATAWVKIAGEDAGGPLFCKGIPGRPGHEDYGLSIGAGGRPASGTGWPDIGRAYSSTGTVAANRWSFVAFSWDERRLAFWVDGKPAGVVPLTLPLKLTEGRLEIGMDSPGEVEYFRGRMAALRLYNLPLNDKQVADLMKFEARFMKLRPAIAPAAAPAVSPAPAPVPAPAVSPAVAPAPAPVPAPAK